MSKDVGAHATTPVCKRAEVCSVKRGHHGYPRALMRVSQGKEHRVHEKSYRAFRVSAQIVQMGSGGPFGSHWLVYWTCPCNAIH